MIVRFWGTRGSLPKPGPDTLRYGGNTSCVEVRSADGTLVVIDCGTGAHALGRALVAEGLREGHLLISHTHWDHIQGIPFFEPLFDERNEWNIYAPNTLNDSVRDALAGQMQYTYFPITMEALGASIEYHDLVEGTFRIADITIRSRYLNHPALTLGYRLEVDGRAVVYACDHEPFAKDDMSGTGAAALQNERHIEFLRDADLVIHDAQYTEAEYPDRRGWGHSTAEYAVNACLAANVKALALTHHDPWRSDDELDRIVANLRTQLEERQQGLELFAAAEQQSIALRPRDAVQQPAGGNWFSAVAPVAPKLADHSVLLGPTDEETVRLIGAAAQAEGLGFVAAGTAQEAVVAMHDAAPSLVLVDASHDREEAIEICRAVKQRADSDAPQAPIVVIADEVEPDETLRRLSTDRLVRPVSPQYMRTRMHAWVLRMTCRWLRAARPADEEQRLAALDATGLLDSEPEERFDRIARLAAEALEVPIALVSLVDRDRQWFKSCIGLEATETPRDMAFCAHAINSDDVLVVPDTLCDRRFADNPLVTGDTRIRFYAGCPIRTADGHALGTLCIIDHRPRNLDARQLRLLSEFAALVEGELG